MSAIKRIMADISELQNPIYADSGIHYIADETNIMKGYACIFGPKDTPYEDCPMMYEIYLNNTFPFDPPSVKFITGDCYTRFHPNMYVDGKVCLSILGTWSGPRWSSIMRISTILVTLQSLLDNDPLRHEPGYEKGREELCKKYKEYIEFSCIKYILSCIESPDKLGVFKNIFLERVPNILERLRNRIPELLKTGEICFSGVPYSLGGNTTYAKFLERVVKLGSMPIYSDK